MSGKLRVTLWITVMTMFFSGLTLMAVLITRSSGINSDPTKIVIDVVEHNVKELEFDDNGHNNYEDVHSYDDGVSTVCIDADGNVVYGALFDEVGFSVPLKNGAIQKKTVNGETYYIYDVLTDTADGEIWFRGTAALSDMSVSTSAILIVTCIFLPILIIVSALGGWLIAWRALKPVDKITKAAASITDGNDLSKRIELKRGTPEMKKLANTFNNMTERLEKSFEAEKQFTSDASHELRTPITVINAECSRARKKCKTKEDFDKSIDVIERNNKKMFELSENLLHITRLEQGTDKYTKRNADLSEFTETICEDLESQHTKNISLYTHIEKGIMFEFDHSLMSRLMSNLIANSYRYGKENGKIDVSLYKKDDHVVFSVEDNGIGIEKNNLDKIWQRFWQEDPSRSGRDGTGLGLAMVKEIAEYHGGTVFAESEKNVGSVFTVTF